jgi:hypothetical protein
MMRGCMQDSSFTFAFARAQVAWLGSFASLLAACSGGGGTAVCRVNADCASGVCLPDGTCQPQGGDGGVDGDAPDATPAPDADPSVCQANHDQTITRAEFPLTAGLHATFTVALDASVSTAGTTNPDGSRAWTLSGALPGDHAVSVDTLPMTGQWFAPDFPDATYAAKLADDSDLLGVFQLSDSALLLLGVVSPDGGTFKTELMYDPPAQALAFPLTDGASWKTQSTVTGVTTGVATLASETWDGKADAHGTLDTPLGHFDRVLRVHVQLTRLVGAVPTVKQNHAFVAECYGTVATIASQDNELQAEFTNAAEVRRIAP